jgi:hypothetical protein
MALQRSRQTKWDPNAIRHISFYADDVIFFGANTIIIKKTQKLK